MKRVILVLPILLLVALFAFFQGCNKDEVVSPLSYSSDLVCPSFSTPIYAGKTMLVGQLVVWNDATNLYVKYDFDEGYTANTFHLWVGCNLSLAPVDTNNKGEYTSLKLGQFPYKLENVILNEQLFTIPLSSLSDCGLNFGCPNNPANIYIIAHAAMENPGGETAFSELGNTNCGKTFETQWGDKMRWGWITCYTICCDPFNQNPPPESGSETAFGKPSIVQGGHVFAWDPKANPENYPTWSLTKNRWGWGGEFNINSSTFPMTFPLWAGCGLNYTTNGMQIGEITLSKDANYFYVMYTPFATYTLSEIHIYLSDAMPTTVAPGQYGNTYTFNPPVGTAQTYEFDLPTGDFYFIGHCVVQIPVTP